MWAVLAVSLACAAGEPTISAEQEASASRTFVLPSLAYTPRTSLLLGAGVIRSQEDGDLEDPLQSFLTAFAYYTIRNQWGVAANTSLYFADDQWLLDSNLSLFDGVSFFFGTGDSPRDDGAEFDTVNLFGDVAVVARLFDTLFVGPALRLQNYRADRIEDSELAALPGSDAGTQIGAGIRLIWDRRDRALWTRSGTFLRASWIGYRADLGSDFSMTELEAELRGFIPLGQDWVLGGQALVESRRGDVPFFRQTRIGAPNRLRGTFSGRFRDEAGWLTQGEIRTPVFWWRLAAVGFLGFGAVAESVGEFGSAEGIVAGGAGLRIAVSDRGANIRMDYGFASDRERAFYVSLGEAF